MVSLTAAAWSSSISRFSAIHAGANSASGSWSTRRWSSLRVIRSIVHKNQAERHPRTDGNSTVMELSVGTVFGVAASALSGGTGLYLIQRFWPTKKEKAEASLTSAEVETQLRTALYTEMKRLAERLDKVELEVTNLETENRSLRAEGAALRSENATLRGRVSSLEDELGRRGSA